MFAAGGHNQRDRLLVHTGGRQQPLAFGILARVPAVRNRVAGQEVAYLERGSRPSMPDDLGATHRLLVGGQPHVDEGVDHRIQLLLGRIPRLEQVVIEVDDVDRLNGRLGIGVGGEKRPTARRGRGPSPPPGTRDRSSPASCGRRASPQRSRPEASTHGASRAPRHPTRCARFGTTRRSGGADLGRLHARRPHRRRR